MSDSSESSPTPPTPKVGANLFRRLAAMVYDGLLLLGLSFAYGGVFGVWLPNALREERMALGEQAWEGWSLLLYQLGWLALILGFFSYFWRRGGQTLGMRAWRLCVRDRAGGPPGYGQCLLRCALAVLSAAALGLGYLWCLFDREAQTWHDRLSGTRTLTLPKP